VSCGYSPVRFGRCWRIYPAATLLVYICKRFVSAFPEVLVYVLALAASPACHLWVTWCAIELLLLGLLLGLGQLLVFHFNFSIWWRFSVGVLHLQRRHCCTVLAFRWACFRSYHLAALPAVPLGLAAEWCSACMPTAYVTHCAFLLGLWLASRLLSSRPVFAREGRKPGSGWAWRCVSMLGSAWPRLWLDIWRRGGVTAAAGASCCPACNSTNPLSRAVQVHVAWASPDDYAVSVRADCTCRCLLWQLGLDPRVHSCCFGDTLYAAETPIPFGLTNWRARVVYLGLRGGMMTDQEGLALRRFLYHILATVLQKRKRPLLTFLPWAHRRSRMRYRPRTLSCMLCLC
jgi:hypothetical protein